MSRRNCCRGEVQSRGVRCLNERLCGLTCAFFRGRCSVKDFLETRLKQRLQQWGVGTKNDEDVQVRS